MKLHPAGNVIVNCTGLPCMAIGVMLEPIAGKMAAEETQPPVPVHKEFRLQL